MSRLIWEYPTIYAYAWLVSQQRAMWDMSARLTEVTSRRRLRRNLAKPSYRSPVGDSRAASRSAVVVGIFSASGLSPQNIRIDWEDLGRLKGQCRQGLSSCRSQTRLTINAWWRIFGDIEQYVAWANIRLRWVYLAIPTRFEIGMESSQATARVAWWDWSQGPEGGNVNE